MEPNKILSAPLIDVIFDGRNKAYGAYYLRNTYSNRIKKSLLVTAVVTALAFGSAAWATSIKKPKPVAKADQGIIMTVINEHQIEKLPELERPPQQQQIRTQDRNPSVIVEDKVLRNPFQEIDETARPGDDNIDGIPDPEITTLTPQGSVDGGKDIITAPNNPPDPIVDIVQVEAKYIGNWVSFLERNLNAEVPVNNGAPAGRYSVVVQFVVDKEGNVSDLKTLTNHGYGLEQEALRVLRKAPKWQPAIQNGYPVKAYRRQVIVFEVTE